MKTRIGSKQGYWWIEVDVSYHNISSFVSHFARFILNKTLAVVAFDGGPLILSEAELKRGWSSKHNIACFNALNLDELNHPIFDNNYDQWLLFDHSSACVTMAMDVYVNYGGFTLLDDLGALSHHKELRDKFWEEILRMNPANFILCGDNFIYGTKQEKEIEEMRDEWC